MTGSLTGRESKTMALWPGLDTGSPLCEVAHPWVAVAARVSFHAAKSRAILACFALVLLFAAPVSAQTVDPHTNWFRASMAAAVVAHSMDLAETQRCIGAQRCTELNPWLLRFKSPSAFAIGKMSIATAELWAIAKLHDSKPKTAIVINAATAVLFASIATHNARVSR